MRSVDDRKVYDPSEQGQTTLPTGRPLGSRDAGTAGASSGPTSIAGAGAFTRGTGIMPIGYLPPQEADHPQWRWDENTGYSIGDFLGQSLGTIGSMLSMFGGFPAFAAGLASRAAGDIAGMGGPGGGPVGITPVDVSLYSPNDPVADLNAVYPHDPTGTPKAPGAKLDPSGLLPGVGGMEGFNFGRSGPGYGPGIGGGGYAGGPAAFDFLKYR